MHIIFLASDPGGLGGIQRYNQNLISAAEESGAQISVLVRERYRNALVFVWTALRSAFRDRQAFIWCGHVRFAPVGWLLSFFGRKYAVFTHGIEAWNLSEPEKRYLRRAFRIVSVSHFTAEKIAARLPEFRSRIFILPNTVNENVFAPAAVPDEFMEKYGLTGKRVILTVARLNAKERYKGYDKVLSALPDIIRRVPEVRYVLCGDKGTDAPRVMEIVQKLGLEENFLLVERANRTELVHFYNAADVFVMPSKGEGFGIVFLESLSCGTPVIAGNKDASSEPLLGGKLGILVNPDDPVAIREAILGVLAKRIVFPPAMLREETVKHFGSEAFRIKVKDFLAKLA